MRKRNLSIVRKGIEDFGDGRKYTPIDLVMVARDCDADTALGSGIMLLSDSEHQAVEQSSAATKRAIDQLDMRIAHLQSELPAVLAAEEAAQAAAKDEALRKRAEACRNANIVESKTILTQIDKLSAQMADALARLKEIADETNSVNEALRRNRVADSVVSYDVLYRKHPDREATGSVSFRAGRYENELVTAVRLQPAFERDVHLAPVISENCAPRRNRRVMYDNLARFDAVAKLESHDATRLNPLWVNRAQTESGARLEPIIHRCLDDLHCRRNSR